MDKQAIDEAIGFIDSENTLLGNDEIETLYEQLTKEDKSLSSEDK
jgi:hypothetical protein